MMAANIKLIMEIPFCFLLLPGTKVRPRRDAQVRDPVVSSARWRRRGNWLRRASACGDSG
jgi:hypothetical protein